MMRIVSPKLLVWFVQQIGNSLFNSSASAMPVQHKAHGDRGIARPFGYLCRLNSSQIQHGLYSMKSYFFTLRVILWLLYKSLYLLFGGLSSIIYYFGVSTSRTRWGK